MGFFEVNKIPLKVITNNGFNVTHSGSNVTQTKMQFDNNELNAPTFFFNSGFDGLEFDISVFIKQDYYYKSNWVGYYLNLWDKWNDPLDVVTDSMIIPNGKYVMSIKNKKQTIEGHSIWQLEFKQYYENSLSFESITDWKGASLSSVDQILARYASIGINQNSPKEAIQALQQKLYDKACWHGEAVQFVNGKPTPIIIQTDDGPAFKQRVPNGVWDSYMSWDISTFQLSYDVDYTTQGVCDSATIAALLGSTYDGEGFYDYQGNRTY